MKVHALLVSIHAPAGGATIQHCGRLCGRCSFNPRARGGRDPAAGVLRGCKWVSIHAPAGGATFTHAQRVDDGTGFNPRARGGRDSRI